MSDRRPDRGSEPFVALYERAASLVYRRARRMLGDGHAARDVTQEVFLRVLDVFPDVGRDPPSVAWLYRVTTNHCLNLLRDGSRHRALLADLPPAASGSATEIPLALLLRGVPEHLHEVAAYYFIDEMSQHEIAAVLGVSQRTVSTRLQEFRAAIKDLWGGVTMAEVST
jgi:RNA polymerase sigma factor (sigma-70 family)